MHQMKKLLYYISYTFIYIYIYRVGLFFYAVVDSKFERFEVMFGGFDVWFLYSL